MTELARDSADQDDPYDGVPLRLRDDVTIVFGAGLATNPEMPSGGLAVDFQLSPLWSIGPMAQVGRDGDLTRAGVGLAMKYYLNPTAPQWGYAPSRFQPFLQGAVGWAFSEDDTTSQNDNSVWVSGSAGIQYRVSDGVSLGTQAFANWVPAELAQESYFISWEALQLILHF